MITNDITPEMLGAIWNAHGLGTVDRVVQPTGGAVNRSFIVNDALVIRFDGLDDFGGINRYAGEQWAYDTLRGSDVPAPAVVALDARKTLAPYDYLILTKVPGKTVNASLAELTPDVLHRIAYTAGEYLATVHRFALDGFGLLFELAAGIAPNDWTAFVENFYRDYEGQVRQNGPLPGETLDRVAAVREKIRPLLAQMKQGRLVHGDYHFSNILQQ